MKSAGRQGSPQHSADFTTRQVIKTANTIIPGCSNPNWYPAAATDAKFQTICNPVVTRWCTAAKSGVLWQWNQNGAILCHQPVWNETITHYQGLPTKDSSTKLTANEFATTPDTTCLYHRLTRCSSSLAWYEAMTFGKARSGRRHKTASRTSLYDEWNE